MDAFHKAGMSGPTLGVAKYDQPLTFRLYFNYYELTFNKTDYSKCRMIIYLNNFSNKKVNNISH